MKLQPIRADRLPLVEYTSSPLEGDEARAELEGVVVESVEEAIGWGEYIYLIRANDGHPEQPIGLAYLATCDPRQ